MRTWPWAERTSAPVPLRVALTDRVIGTAEHERPDRRINVQFGDGGSSLEAPVWSVQAEWQVMEI